MITVVTDVCNTMQSAIAWVQQHTYLEVDNDDEGRVGGHTIREEAIAYPTSPGLP